MLSTQIAPVAAPEIGQSVAHEAGDFAGGADALPLLDDAQEWSVLVAKWQASQVPGSPMW